MVSKSWFQQPADFNLLIKIDSICGGGSQLRTCEPPPSRLQSNVVQFEFDTESPEPSAVIMHPWLVAEIPG